MERIMDFIKEYRKASSGGEVKRLFLVAGIAVVFSLSVLGLLMLF